MKKNYLFFLAILLSIQSFAQQYQVAGTCTNNTMLFKSETASNFRQRICSSSDFVVASPSGKIAAVYAKVSSGNQITNSTMKIEAMGLKHMFNMLNLKS